MCNPVSEREHCTVRNKEKQKAAVVAPHICAVAGTDKQGKIRVLHAVQKSKQAAPVESSACSAW